MQKVFFPVEIERTRHSRWISRMIAVYCNFLEKYWEILKMTSIKYNICVQFSICFRKVPDMKLFDKKKIKYKTYHWKTNYIVFKTKKIHMHIKLDVQSTYIGIYYQYLCVMYMQRSKCHEINIFKYFTKLSSILRKTNLSIKL